MRENLEDKKRKGKGPGRAMKREGNIRIKEWTIQQKAEGSSGKDKRDRAKHEEGCSVHLRGNYLGKWSK